MRDHSSHIELTREEAVRRMLEASGFADVVGNPGESSLRVEGIAVADAAGRVLARDVEAQFDAPNALTCALDSIAVRYDDFEDGKIPDTSAWTRGVNWDFANTGVAMPEGFDTAIVIEHVRCLQMNSMLKLMRRPRGVSRVPAPWGRACMRAMFWPMPASKSRPRWQLALRVATS